MPRDIPFDILKEVEEHIPEPFSKWDLNTKRKASQDTDGVLSFEDTT